jgi:broad specificity phosphatase PhoE
METIFLMRHGETAWNQEKRVMGRLEIPLSRKGIAQGKRIAKLLPDLEIRAIYTSPLRRALETARILAKECHKSVKINSNLTEVAFGRWQGYRFDDLIKDEAYHRFLRTPLRATVPGGETIVDVQRRGLRAIRRAIREYPKDRLLFVSHGDVIRAILCHYLKLPLQEFRRLRIDNGTLSTLEVDGPWAEIKYLNYVPDVTKVSNEPFSGLKPGELKRKKSR